MALQMDPRGKQRLEISTGDAMTLVRENMNNQAGIGTVWFARARGSGETNFVSFTFFSISAMAAAARV
jgi:hypothetical protein